MRLTAKELEDCVRVLERLVADRADLLEIDAATRRRLLEAAGRVSRPERTEQRQLARASRKAERVKVRTEDDAQRERAGIRQERLRPIFLTPHPLAARHAAGGRFAVGDAPASSQTANALASASEQTARDEATASGDPTEASASYEDGVVATAPELNQARACYVCKQRCTRMHVFYDQLCGECGDFNFRKRSATADLRGRVAYISGARVKIGYQAAMMLLRAGARVIVSTRFPRDAAQRFAREVDFSTFRERLVVYGLDLRHTPSVEAFARHLCATEERLDFVLHNACQTVRRPTGFYAHLMAQELESAANLPPTVTPLLADYERLRANVVRTLTSGDGGSPSSLAVGLYAAPSLSQVALMEEDRTLGHALFPTGALDADLQQVDLRSINSWRLALHEVGTVELLEVQLVNAIAPFVLNARLKPLMLRHRTFDKHIVNVSAMEGQFYRRFKTDKHPHTNMAKAALNMMTRTSAPDYAKDGIFMNSVDTGWITDEDAAPIAARKTVEKSFHPPLDIVDGAARIVDPIFNGITTGEHVWGQFLKDYRPTAW